MRQLRQKISRRHHPLHPELILLVHVVRLRMRGRTLEHERRRRRRRNQSGYNDGTACCPGVRPLVPTCAQCDCALSFPSNAVYMGTVNGGPRVLLTYNGPHRQQASSHHSMGMCSRSSTPPALLHGPLLPSLRGDGGGEACGKKKAFRHGTSKQQMLATKHGLCQQTHLLARPRLLSLPTLCSNPPPHPSEWSINFWYELFPPQSEEMMLTFLCTGCLYVWHKHTFYDM